jgi:hypothetical protein
MAGSQITHIAGIRVRVVGAGNLLPVFQGYDDIITQTLVAVPMSATDSREKTRLCNFISQASKLKLYTTEENEIFRINHIWIYIKPLYTDYPA